MIPLAPSERREIESKLHFVTYLENPTVVSNGAYTIIIDKYNRDLWLKVLSMALAHNDVISDEWRSKK